MTKEFNPENDLEFIIDDKLKEYFKAESIDNPTSADKTTLTTTLTEAYQVEVEKIKTRIIYFDHNQDFFERVVNEVNENFKYEIVKDLESLPKRLAGSEAKILFIYYSGYPRLCNQMIPLVRTKFKSVIIVMVAKKLTAEKVQEHSESELAADDYLSVPFTKEDMFRIIMKYN